jgi:hypothetical protein
MFMSLEMVARTIAYLKKSGERRFSIIGGEPTLHPHLEEIIRMVLEAGMSVNLFTNDVMSAETAAMLAEVPEGKLDILANINNLDTYTEAERAKLLHAMEVLAPKCNVGYNIHSLDFDFVFLADLVNQFGMRRVIRLGIASPIYGGDNVFIPTSDFKALGPRIAEQTVICDEKDVVVGFDCGFTLCMFTENEIGRLYKCNAQLDFHCQPVIDVGLDHQVWTCFPLSDWKRVRLDDFETVADIVAHYNREMFLYHCSGVYNECHTCKHQRRGKCAGGCVSRVLHSFK